MSRFPIGWRRRFRPGGLFGRDPYFPSGYAGFHQPDRLREHDRRLFFLVGEALGLELIHHGSSMPGSWAGRGWGDRTARGVRLRPVRGRPTGGTSTNPGPVRWARRTRARPTTLCCGVSPERNCVRGRSGWHPLPDRGRLLVWRSSAGKCLTGDATAGILRTAVSYVGLEDLCTKRNSSRDPGDDLFREDLVDECGQCSQIDCASLPRSPTSRLRMTREPGVGHLCAHELASNGPAEHLCLRCKPSPGVSHSCPIFHFHEFSGL